MERETASRITPLSLIRKRPLAALCLCYLLGALAQVEAPVGERVFLTSTGVLALLALARRRSWRSNWRPGLPEWLSVLMPAAAFVAGVLFSATRLAVPATDVSHYTSPHFTAVRGVLMSRPRMLPFGVSAEMECWEAQQGSSWILVTGKTQLWGSRRASSGPDSGSTLLWRRLGQPLEVRGLLQPIISGSSAGADSLLRHQIYSTLKIGKGGRITPLQPDGVSAGGTLRGWCEEAMQWTLDGLGRELEPRERDALAGMLFHQQENMTPGTLDDLQKTGTIHIVATAGLHVGIFMGCCLFALRPWLPHRTTIWLTMALLAGYCVACGGWPAVFRATVVAELYLLARLLGRLPDPFTCLSLTAAWMVFLEPNALLDSGFQFTFATVGVILLVMSRKRDPNQPKDNTLRGRVMQHVRGIAGLSLAAQLGSWPLTAYYFNIVSFVGLFANLLIVPLLIVIIPLAMFTAIVSHLLPRVAIYPGALLQDLIHLLLWIAHKLAAWPWGWRYMDNVSWPAVVFYYMAVAIGVGWLRMRWAASEEPG